MKYLITYDLYKPGQDYQDLFDAIESLGQSKHGMQNAWFVKSKYSAIEIRDYLKTKVDENDKIFVSGISDWASSNMRDVADWLNSNS